MLGSEYSSTVWCCKNKHQQEHEQASEEMEQKPHKTYDKQEFCLP
jgi:hypothetical protein